MSMPDEVADQGGTIPEKLNDNLTIDELALFLEKKENIPVIFCQELKGNRILILRIVHAC